MSIRIDIEWLDGAIEARHLTGPGPWTIGGRASDVNLPGIDGIVARAMRDAAQRIVVACPPDSPPQPWRPGQPLVVGPASLHLFGDEDGEDDVATVALVRPTLDELASVALPRPAAATPTGAAPTSASAAAVPGERSRGEACVAATGARGDGDRPGAPAPASVGTDVHAPRSAMAHRAAPLETTPTPRARRRVSPAELGLWALVVAMGAGLVWLIGGGR